MIWQELHFWTIWWELLFLKKGLGCIEKGANAPLLSEKGVSAKFTKPKLPTEFSFGIGMVNTGNIPTNTDQKYWINIKLYKNIPGYWTKYCGDAWSLEQASTLRAMHNLNTPKNYIRLLGGLLSVHSTCWCGAQGLMWGTRRLFLLTTTMIVVVVMPLMCCCRMARAKTTLVQWNPGILGIVRKLWMSPRQLHHHTLAVREEK